MPAKFNLKSVRAHLEQTWGLGTSRQSSVLLFALTLSTTLGATRLASIAAAKELLDKAAKTYAEACGLALQAQSDKLNQHVNAESAMDPSVLVSVQQEAKNQRHLATRQVRALSEYLGINLGGNNDSESEVVDRALRDRLAVWEAEFGDDFALGIKARLDSRLVRRFNFAWNQARQELIALYQHAETVFQAGNFQKHSNDELRSLASKVSNKSNADTARLVRALLDSIPERLRDSHPFHKIGNTLIENMNETAHLPPRAKFDLSLLMPQTSIGEDGSIQYHELPRTGFVGACYSSLLRSGHQESSRVFLRRAGNASEEDLNLTDLFLQNISEILQNGANFSGRCILVTGAGSGSIGVELIKYLLNGGAHVIVATSRPPSSSSKFYRDIYAEHGSRGSQINVVPFNQASSIDCKELIEYIYNPSGLAKNLDAIIPFAATSEEGVEIDKIDGKSELAHRIMLTNILRILGHISRCKKEQNITCRPTQVILPLSPNHGIFGGDGLYSESKLGLEGLLNRFYSESWSEEITVVGVIIGWTRGTGLMQQNDVVAQAIEECGVLTFSQKEMALNVLALLSPEIAEACEEASIIADFSGGLGRLENCNQVLSSARDRIRLESQILKAVREEDRLEAQCCAKLPIRSDPQPLELRTTLQLPFPTLPDFSRDLEQLHHLQKMADLSGTVVIVGYSELGPWGNARTRWEKESQNRLAQSAYVELAWMMNLIKHFDGDTAQGYFVGWVDTKSGERVLDSEVEGKYGAFILSHSGIRFIDPDLSSGYDPTKKESLQEIIVEEDLPEFETDYATAEGIKRRNGDKISFTRLDGQDQCRVQIKSGAHIMVPRSSNFDTSLVAGQLPKGWSAATYGVEEDIISQVDPVTLYALCCVAEALFSAGITNAMEIYKHIHTSDIGNFIGSSMGGTDKTRQMYRDVYLDKRVQGDIIQETFLNTPAAWVNMLLLGSNGPIKTPVGACATGVESIDIGFDSIMSGKTKICLVGGTDNFHEDESYAFSTMKATVNTASELLHGRTPSEMSRPTAESRAGFVESQGCGVQVLCSAELAIEMGLPIYGIGR
jgi:fatty acid synthase subunit alpha